MFPKQFLKYKLEEGSTQRAHVINRISCFFINFCMLHYEKQCTFPKRLNCIIYYSVICSLSLLSKRLLMIYNTQCILLPSIRLNITRSVDLMRNSICIFVYLLFCKSSAESGQGSLRWVSYVRQWPSRGQNIPHLLPPVHSCQRQLSNFSEVCCLLQSMPAPSWLCDSQQNVGNLFVLPSYACTCTCAHAHTYTEWQKQDEGKVKMLLDYKEANTGTAWRLKSRKSPPALAQHVQQL